MTIEQGDLCYVDDASRPRVVFGAGSLADVAAEVTRLGGSRVLLISTTSARTAADGIARDIGDGIVGRVDGVAMHVPDDEVRRTRALAAKLTVDLVLCIGGGSAVGLAKSIAHETGLPLLAVPTTYAGSEMTTIWGRTAEGRKQTGRDSQVLPHTVIYDPVLTVGLPAAMSITSGLNAIAHCIESLYAPDATSLTTRSAADGMTALIASLPTILREPADLAARARALHGARRSGQALESTQMGLHHVLCHALGGVANLPHSPTHAVLLPHVVAWNESAAGSALDPVRSALGMHAGDRSIGCSLWDFSRRLGAPGSLAALGLSESHVAKVLDDVDLTRVRHPRRPTTEDVRILLMAGLSGQRPSPEPQAS